MFDMFKKELRARDEIASGGALAILYLLS